MPRPPSTPRLVVYGPTAVAGWPCKVKRGLKSHRFYIVDRTRGVERSTAYGIDRQSEAQQALVDYLGAIGGLTQSDDPSVSDILGLYSQAKVVDQRNSRSTDSNMRMLVRHLTDVTVSQLTEARVKQYVKDRKASSKGRRGGTLGNGAIRRDIEILQAALNYAASEGAITVARKLWKPSAPARRERWLTHTEAAKLVRAARRAGDWEMTALILITLHTCARREAVLTLRWSPSELGGHINTQADSINFRPVGWKASKKVRTQIPIPDRLRWLIRALRRRHPEWVCGGIMNPKGRWKKLLAEAKIPHITMHGLCHTAISWQMQRGPDTWRLSRFAGRSRKMLEDVYGQLHPVMLRDIARGR